MVTIRGLTAADLDAAVAIVAQCNAFDADNARLAFERELAGAGRSQHVVAEREGCVVGVSGWMQEGPQGQDVYWLGWTYVDRASRRQGIGAALLAHVLGELRARSARKLYLDTGARGYEAAVAFYLRHGFVEEARLPDYYAEGEDCLILARRV